MTKKEKEKINLAGHEEIGRLEKHYSGGNNCINNGTDYNSFKKVEDGNLSTTLNLSTEKYESSKSSLEIVRGNITVDSKIQEKTVNNDDESKYDTRNNIVQEIDTLNKVADEQLNETKAKYDTRHIYSKHFYTRDDVGNVVIMNNVQNSDNSVDNYSVTEELKTKQNEIKRSNQEEQTTLKTKLFEKNVSKQNAELKIESNKGVDNPILADFHVIDSEKDLEVPSGVEGPVPTVVLPPANFVPPPISSSDSRRLQYKHSTNGPTVFEPLPNIVIPPQNLQGLVEVPDVLLPPFNFGPESVYNGDMRGLQNFQPAYPPPGVEGPRAAVPAPPYFTPQVPNGDSRNLQSIYTARGPYYYFKANDDVRSRRYFIPLG